MDRWPTVNVTMLLMCAFFTCVGLNATWEVVREGSVQVVIFLGVATVLAMVQNVVGLGLARMLHVDPLIGLVCGSVTLTGGHGTALGFSGALEKLGLQHAALLGAAAATLGLVAGGLFGGPIAERFIRKLRREPTVLSASSFAEA